MGKGVQSAWPSDASVLHSVFITVAGRRLLAKVQESQGSQRGSVSPGAWGKPPREPACPAAPDSPGEIPPGRPSAPPPAPTNILVLPDSRLESKRSPAACHFIGALA